MSQSQTEVLRQENWSITRTIRFTEVHKSSGNIVYHIEVGDEGRKPFISRWFNDPVPAEDFYDRIKKAEGGQQ